MSTQFYLTSFKHGQHYFPGNITGMNFKNRWDYNYDHTGRYVMNLNISGRTTGFGFTSGWGIPLTGKVSCTLTGTGIYGKKILNEVFISPRIQSGCTLSSLFSGCIPMRTITNTGYFSLFGYLNVMESGQFVKTLSSFESTGIVSKTGFRNVMIEQNYFDNNHTFNGKQRLVLEVGAKSLNTNTGKYTFQQYLGWNPNAKGKPYSYPYYPFIEPNLTSNWWANSNLANPEYKGLNPGGVIAYANGFMTPIPSPYPNPSGDDKYYYNAEFNVEELLLSYREKDVCQFYVTTEVASNYGPWTFSSSNNNMPPNLSVTSSISGDTNAPLSTIVLATACYAVDGYGTFGLDEADFQTLENVRNGVAIATYDGNPCIEQYNLLSSFSILDAAAELNTKQFRLQSVAWLIPNNDVVLTRIDGHFPVGF